MTRNTGHSSPTQVSVEAKHMNTAVRSRQRAMGVVGVLAHPVIALHISFPHTRLSISRISLPPDECYLPNLSRILSMAVQPHIPFSGFILAFAQIRFWLPRRDVGCRGSVWHCHCEGEVGEDGDQTGRWSICKGTDFNMGEVRFGPSPSVGFWLHDIGFL